MPLPSGVRYRWKKTKKGKIRLAFKNNKVLEVKKKGKKAKRVGGGGKRRVRLVPKKK